MEVAIAAASGELVEELEIDELRDTLQRFRPGMLADELWCKVQLLLAELGSLACGMIRRLELEDEAFDLVLAGSLYNGSPVLAAELGRTVHELAPDARLDAPVIGGVLLGMEAANHNATDARTRLLKSTPALLSAYFLSP